MNYAKISFITLLNLLFSVSLLSQSFNKVEAKGVENKNTYIDGPSIDTLIKYNLNEEGIVIHHSENVVVFLSNIEHPNQKKHYYPAIFRFEKKGNDWKKIYAHYFHAKLTRDCFYGDADKPVPQAVYEPKTGNIVVYGQRFALFFEHKTQEPTYMTEGDFKFTSFHDGVVLCDSMIAIAGEVHYEGYKTKTVVYLFRTGIMKYKKRSFDMDFGAGCPQLVKISDNSFYCYNSKKDSLHNAYHKLRKFKLDRNAKEGKGSLIEEWKKELVVKSKAHPSDEHFLMSMPESNTFKMIDNKLVILYRWSSPEYYSIGVYDLNGNLIWDKFIPNSTSSGSRYFIDSWDDGTILFGYTPDYNTYSASELYSIGLDGEIKDIVRLPHQVKEFMDFKGTIKDFTSYATYDYYLRKIHFTMK
ncbi:MAG: hypothetical protein KDC84_00895 [Crocinitomicaceae bacterium]|nr:hypothetical protein [Crocinitomicaceae bacterium]